VNFAITGIGVVSPIGVGAEAFFAGIAEGRSAVTVEDGVPLARVGEFGAKKAIAAGSLRRMPRLTQMTIVAAKEALAAAPAIGEPSGARRGASGEGGLPPGSLGGVPSRMPGMIDETRIGVVLGTGLGTLDETTDFMKGYLEGGPEAASPLIFPYSVMNAAAGHLALECKLRGVNSTVNHRELSSVGALTMGCDLLALGRADALVVGGVDELSGPALEGYRKLSALGTMHPYDKNPRGLALGEGAFVALLEREDDARARGAKIFALVVGRGESGETRPRVGWGRDLRWPEAARAVREAAAGRAIDFVMGGGNGTALDERELGAVEEGLGTLPPVASVLAQTGESFASSMLRVLAGIDSLQNQRLPGTVGVEQPIREAVVVKPRAAKVDRVLIPAFAQGGGNCVVVLERA
jgi:3-oxoacyl-[acyl-carrier-protein] synthase II